MTQLPAKRPRPYERTSHDGKTVDWHTKAALLKAERLLGYELSIVQGSYNRGVSASAGTHDGGGVVDLLEWDWPNKVRALRLAGFAAWHRPKGPSWNGHIHAVLVGNKMLSSSAADQVDDFRAGRDGLAGNRPDPHGGTVFRPFPWTYRGPIGAVRWQMHRRQGAARRRYRQRLRNRLNLK